MRHQFGGQWTEQKLGILRSYLQFFPKALSGKFNLVYIDTFAGTGKCTIKGGPDGERTIEGSAAIALGLDRPFDEYHFIEMRHKHVLALNELRDSHPLKDRISIVHGDAHAHLTGILESINWDSSRGVLFLDPYGLQCSWDMVKQVARTRALDVFFLVSVSGLARQAARHASAIDSDKEAALDRFLGTPDWRKALYKPPAQGDMFIDKPSDHRELGVEAILQFVASRLQGEFAYVAEPVPLYGPNNAMLYALFFAVANRSEKAKQLAARVNRDILSKLR